MFTLRVLHRSTQEAHRHRKRTLGGVACIGHTVTHCPVGMPLGKVPPPLLSAPSSPITTIHHQPAPKLMPPGEVPPPAFTPTPLGMQGKTANHRHTSQNCKPPHVTGHDPSARQKNVRAQRVDIKEGHFICWYPNKQGCSEGWACTKHTWTRDTSMQAPPSTRCHSWQAPT